MKLKTFISIFLLLISIILIAMPAIPHHHHGNGTICMKDDLKNDDCCTMEHNHHHEEDDPCCNGACATHVFSTPTIDSENSLPPLICLDILFTESIIRFITQPLEKNIHDDFVFVEFLHGTYITRAAGLRAPPLS
ncbi:DUF6769 family protein [Bacteroides sp. 519]|uniref:DUF6769 family protein n=1 Tax=Bacteroides sp. 519 TaxID=2302937 RepID=UPI0013CF871E|nr:DUF6769 family protein [Bacteroides sp. 519]NDV57931.1 hypothetical protein [Bacteroides sp. 519]